MKHVDYDLITDKFGQRYTNNSLDRVFNALVKLAQKLNVNTILEVGCGTGYWLDRLASKIPETHFFGLDNSMGMLTKAQNHFNFPQLILGNSGQLPLKNHTFDLIFCINAFHHFNNPQSFVYQAKQVLRPGGTIAIIGQVLQDRHRNWYVYEYFDGVFKMDLQRFPTWGTVMDWMQGAAFHQFQLQPIERISVDKQGWELLDDPFLQKHAVSQLAILDDDAYFKGIDRIKDVIRKSELTGSKSEFNVQMRLDMITAEKPDI